MTFSMRRVTVINAEFPHRRRMTCCPSQTAKPGQAVVVIPLASHKYVFLHEQCLVALGIGER